MGDIIKALKQLGIDGINEWQGVPQSVKAGDRTKALDMLTRIMGGYAPEKKEVTGNIKTESTINLNDLPEELAAQILKQKFENGD